MSNKNNVVVVNIHFTNGESISFTKEYDFLKDILSWISKKPDIDHPEYKNDYLTIEITYHKCIIVFRECITYVSIEELVD